MSDETFEARDRDYGSPNDKNKQTSIYEDWLKCKQWQDEKNLSGACAVYQDYVEGRQSKYMSKQVQPVQLNVIGPIIKNKVSTICESPVDIDYFSNASTDDSQNVTRFSNYQLAAMNWEDKLRSFVYWAEVHPVTFAHIYWNEDAVGQESIAQGGIRLERLSCLNVGVANPTLKDIQDQEWIITAVRDNVRKAKEMCEKKSDREFIKPDDNEMDGSVIEQDDNALVTVFTRYFRKDGEVYFEKSTSNVVLCEPKPMNPNISYEKSNEKEDAETSKSPDSTLDKPTQKDIHMKFNLYPIEPLVLDESFDSYLGISDVDGMISPQNVVNLMFSLTIQNGIDIQAKYLVKDGALQNEEITNTIGETLHDHYRGQGDGIKVINGGATMTNQMLQVPLSLIETMKKLNASSDVTMGDVSKEYSATAISLLQTAAEKPTEGRRRQVELFSQRLGRIFLLYYKFYYENARYMFKADDHERKQIAESINIGVNPDGSNQTLPVDQVPSTLEGRFDGRRYQDEIFDIQVTAGQGGKLSQSTEFQYIVQFMQTTQNMSPQQKRLFIKATPEYILHSKQELLDLVDEEENGQVSQLEGKLQEAAQVIETYKAGSKQLATYLNYLKNYIKEYQKESGSYMSNQDQTINQMLNESESTSNQLTSDQKGAVKRVNSTIKGETASNKPTEEAKA